MKFLADMGISPKTVRWLREREHDAVHLMDRERVRRAIHKYCVGRGVKGAFY